MMEEGSPLVGSTTVPPTAPWSGRMEPPRPPMLPGTWAGFSLFLLGCGSGYSLEPPFTGFCSTRIHETKILFEHGLTRTLRPRLGPAGSRHSQQAVFAALPALVWVIFATFAVSG